MKDSEEITFNKRLLKQFISEEIMELIFKRRKLHLHYRTEYLPL